MCSEDINVHCSPFLMKEPSLCYDSLTFRNIASSLEPPEGSRDSRMIKKKILYYIYSVWLHYLLIDKLTVIIYYSLLWTGPS